MHYNVHYTFSLTVLEHEKSISRGVGGRVAEIHVSIPKLKTFSIIWYKIESNEIKKNLLKFERESPQM